MKRESKMYIWLCLDWLFCIVNVWDIVLIHHFDVYCIISLIIGTLFTNTPYIFDKSLWLVDFYPYLITIDLSYVSSRQLLSFISMEKKNDVWSHVFFCVPFENFHSWQSIRKSWQKPETYIKWCIIAGRNICILKIIIWLKYNSD